MHEDPRYGFIDFWTFSSKLLFVLYDDSWIGLKLDILPSNYLHTLPRSKQHIFGCLDTFRLNYYVGS